MKTVIALLMLPLAALVHAEDSPKVRAACKRADSGSYFEYNRCVAAMYEEKDAALNKLYAETIHEAKKHPYSKEVETGVRASQRAWLSFRDSTCEMASWIEGYANAPARRGVCLMEMTTRRIVELEEVKRCVVAQGYGGDCPLSQ